MSTNTCPIKVHNAAFLLERLSADCAPLQEYRELTQNAIEAVTRTREKRGTIIWDVDWQLVEAKGIYKLSIADDGVGMTPQEMQFYINELSHSGSEQSLAGNFGIGAKITAGTRNPYGVAYFSWQNDQGANIVFWRDPERLQYGLKQFEHESGDFAHWRPVDSTLKRDPIRQRGTAVVLLGKSAEQNTALPPEGAPYGTHWLTRYLNARYFRFPPGVSVRVREFARADPKGWPTSKPKKLSEGAFLRPVHGQARHLDSECDASGRQVLSGGIAYWWILKKVAARSRKSLWQSSGHVAALYQNELYEMRTGQSGQRLLQQFGVLFGSNRVVIYIEPALELEVSANTARSVLVSKGNPLPWDTWAEEFRKAMPDQIKSMMDEILEGSTSQTHRDAIRTRLKSIEKLYQLKRYKRSPDGPLHTSGAFGNATEDEHSTRSVSQREDREAARGNQSGDLYSQIARASGDRAIAVRKQMVEPKTQWIRSSDATRSPGEIEDRAGRYLPEQHTLLLNADFRAFTEMIDHWTTRYKAIPAAPPVVRDVVLEWFEQQAVEAVLGTIALAGSQTWSDDHIKMALSEEALTAAVMPRWHVYSKIGQVLARRLGRQS